MFKFLDRLFARKSVNIQKDIIERLGAIGIETSSGALVTPDTAMRLATTYACVRVISESLAQLPFRLLRRTEGRNHEPAPEHPVGQLLRRPNSWQTPAEFWGMMAANAVLRGNGYAIKTKGNTGPIRELLPVQPSAVKSITQNDDLSLTYSIVLAGESEPEDFEQDQIFHVRALTQDGIFGLSPVSATRETFGLAQTQEKSAGRLFANGIRLSGVLKHPSNLSEEAQKRLRDSWVEATTGKNEYGIALLEEGMEFQAMSMTAEDAQFIEARKFSKVDIAGIFGVPLFLLNDTEKSTTWGTGLEQLSTAFVRFTLMPWLKKFEEAVSRDLIGDDEREEYFAKFNVDALMRGEYKERQEGLAIQKQNGVITGNQWRAMENMNEVTDDPEMDRYRPSANLYGIIEEEPAEDEAEAE